MRDSGLVRRVARGVVLAAAVSWHCTAVGCMVEVYQPLSGFHQPIVVDPRAPNFQDLRLTVVCPQGQVLTRGEAHLLCERVSRLFENQGAKIVDSTRDGRADEGGLGQDSAVPEAGASAVAPTDLVVELRARDIQTTRHPVSWLLSYATLSLVPGVDEETFAQDIVIRDATGFLLVSDTLRGRIVRSSGIGIWAANRLLDRVWRDPAEDLSDDAAKKDLSADFYGQLTQRVFNAKMQWQVHQLVARADVP